MDEPFDIFPPASLELYTLDQVAELLQVSRRTVSNWIRQGALPAIRLGPGRRILRVRRLDLEAFIDCYTVNRQTPDTPGEHT